VLSKSKTSPTGGLLRFTDILELKQHADLVVLSACDTGLVQLREAEGIIGLTRAFLYGGASSAVVSLWKVEDQSTGLLMQEFHRRLKAGQSKEEALREAKLKIMNTQILLKATGTQEFLADPFFWASFILIGDRRPINLR
jgi:CHAT domain-containing protein